MRLTIPIIRWNTILSGRALVLLFFLLLLFGGPVQKENDIVASELAYALCAVIAFFALATLIQGIRIKRTIKSDASVASNTPNKNGARDLVYALKDENLLIRIEKFSVWPLFSLELSLVFEHEGVITPSHRLTSGSETRTAIGTHIRFPHRGLWKLEGINFKYGDRFGLCSFKWFEHFSGTKQRIFKVAPLPYEKPGLPIISSSYRPGDTVSDQNERLGDYLDLKPYHPADGMKKIVWKLFAKSGELISRHPERSMTPEGQVAIFCLALPQDDRICAVATNYISQLKELNLDVLVGGSGSAARELAKNTKGAEDLFIETVWDNESITNDSIRTDTLEFLGKCSSALSGNPLSKVVVFLSEDCGPIGTVLGEIFQSQQVEPVFFVEQKTFSLNGSESKKSSLNAIPKFIKRWALESDQNIQGNGSGKRDFQEFLSICLRHNWQVVL